MDQHSSSSSVQEQIDSFIKELKMFQLPCGMYLSIFYQSTTSFEETGVEGGRRQMASGAHCLYPPGVKIDFHQQEFDEILVPIHGCSVDVAVILPTGEVRREVLGKNLIAGEKLNISVPKGSFMGSIFFKREKLLELFPQHTQTVLDFSSEVSQQATASE